MSRILFVGAEHTITEMTGKLLKRNGFDVQCAVGKRKLSLRFVHNGSLW